MTDVAIVGAGPVGLLLAIQLAQRGRSVVVLEQWPTPYTLPRAVHFDHEVGRILQSCGIGDEVRAISEPAEVYEWRNGAGDVLLRIGRAGVAGSGWPFSSMFCQPEMEGLLLERALSLPGVEIRRGVKVSSLDDVAEARFVVGCDGANSTVRSLLGIDVDDRGFFYDWLIVDVVLSVERTFNPLNVQICDPVRPTTCVSGGPGRRRWEFMRLPDERVEDLNDEARAWELLAPWDVHPGNASLERHTVYTFQARVASQWQSGNVFLAGDAAHQMPPFAGQGLCAGLRDAMNLAWKLDLVLGGSAGPGLLATYDSERRPSAEAAVDFSIELGKVICVPDVAEAAARDAAMTAAFDGSVSPAAELPGLPLVPQGRLADGRWFDDVHGVGFRLLTLDDPASFVDDGGWFTSIGGAVVAAPDDVRSWFDDRGVRWALQRPDFHLFGTAVDGAGVPALLDDLRRHLA